MTYLHPQGALANYLFIHLFRFLELSTRYQAQPRTASSAFSMLNERVARSLVRTGEAGSLVPPCLSLSTQGILPQ